MTPYIPWIIFGVIVLTALSLDLFLFNRRARDMGIKEATLWSLFWIGLAFLFNVGIYFWHGSSTAVAFLTGYLIEESLSVDNLFVFLMIFAYFGVKAKYQHKVLFWGIVGVFVMRGTFILAGVTLLNRFHWLIYLMGAFLLFTGIKMALHKDKKMEPGRNPVLRLARRIFPIADDGDDGRFFLRRRGRTFITPLFIVVAVVESTDLLFAVDSIPAVFAITTDPFVVFTSNIFAVMGLRAIFFALAGAMTFFHHLSYGLSAILAFVGIKMILSGFYKIPVGIALGVVACILLLSVAASLAWPPEKKSSET